MGNHDVFMAAPTWMKLCPLCGRGAYRRPGEMIPTWKARSSHLRCIVEQGFIMGLDAGPLGDAQRKREMRLSARDTRDRNHAIASGRGSA